MSASGAVWYSPRVDEAAKARRAARARWATGVTRSSEHEAAEQRFWALSDANARYRALWELVVTAWSLEHPDEPFPRLDRSVSGVRFGRR